MPKVSVIMPAYNAQAYIKEAIDSILGQTFTDFELIILNDCSRDATEELILSYADPRVVYVKNEQNMGVAGTLNKGLTYAHGTYIARMDADDIAMPDRLERQVAFMDERSDLVGCGSNAILFGQLQQEGKTDMPLDDKGIRVRMAVSNPFVHPTMLLRREAVKNQGYDKKFEGREDYRLWMVLSQKGKMENLPQFLLRYRIHAGQVTQKPDDAKAQKHFQLKRTYYQELNIGLTDAMQEALSYAAYYGRVNNQDQALQLKLGLERLAQHYECRGLPREYSAMLCGCIAHLPRGARWKLSRGLPLKTRISLMR